MEYKVDFTFTTVSRRGKFEGYTGSIEVETSDSAFKILKNESFVRDLASQMSMSTKKAVFSLELTAVTPKK